MLVGKTWDGAVQRWLADNSEKRSLKSDQSNILWLNKFLSDVRLLVYARQKSRTIFLIKK